MDDRFAARFTETYGVERGDTVLRWWPMREIRRQADAVVMFHAETRTRDQIENELVREFITRFGWTKYGREDEWTELIRDEP